MEHLQGAMKQSRFFIILVQLDGFNKIKFTIFKITDLTND